MHSVVIMSKSKAFESAATDLIRWAQQAQERPFDRYARVLYNLPAHLTMPDLRDAANITKQAAWAALREAEERGLVQRVGFVQVPPNNQRRVAFRRTAKLRKVVKVS